MTDIVDWSKTPADNASADTRINWAEGQAPSTVNGSARQMMAAIAEWRDDITPKRLSAGSGNAYTITTNTGTSGAYRDGEWFAFVADRENTGTATLNVNGRGAKPLRPAVGVEHSAGEIQANQVIVAYFRSSSDEFLTANTGYHLNAMTEGLLSQNIGSRLLRVGDPIISLAPSPEPGRIRLTESTQTLNKADYPELNSWLSGHSYPWGSASTTFNLPPAAGYFLRFAATSSSVDTSGARTAGSTQSDQNKAHTHSVTGTVTTTLTNGDSLTRSTANTSADTGGAIATVDANTVTRVTVTAASTFSSGTAASSGGDEVRVKNVAFHVDIVASTALAAAFTGAYGFPYEWDTGTTEADPGSGRIRGNNATIASITAIYVSETDSYGTSLSGLLSQIVSGSRIKFSKVSAPANEWVFQASGAPTDAGSYQSVPGTMIAVNSGISLSNNDIAAIELIQPGATGASYYATSSSSVAINLSGTKSFTTQSGLAYSVGARVRASDSANPADNWIEGIVTSYSSTTMVIDPDKVSGSGTISSWNINVAGEPGAPDIDAAISALVGDATTAGDTLGELEDRIEAVEASAQYVNAKHPDYGATGDGSTDDTTAIQAALDAGLGPVWFPPGVYCVSSEIVIPDGSGIVGSGAHWKRRTGYTYNGAHQTVVKYIGAGGSNTCVVRASNEPVGTQGNDFSSSGDGVTDDLINVVARDFHVDANGLADIGMYVYRAGNQSTISNVTAEKAVSHNHVHLGCYAAKFGLFGAYESENHGVAIGWDIFNWGSVEATNFAYEGTFHLCNNGTSATYVAGTGTDLECSGGLFSVGRGSVVKITSESNYGRAAVLKQFNSVLSASGPTTYILEYLEGNADGPYTDYRNSNDAMFLVDGFVHPGNGSSLLPQNITIESKSDAGTLLANAGPDNQNEWLRIRRLFGDNNGTGFSIISNTDKYIVEDCTPYLTYGNVKPRGVAIAAGSKYRSPGAAALLSGEEGEAFDFLARDAKVTDYTGVLTASGLPSGILTVSRALAKVVGGRHRALESVTSNALGYDYDQSDGSPLGVLIEPAATNVVLYCRDLTNAAWTKTNVTATKDQAGILGVANSATRLAATAANGTCLQSIVLASAARFQSAYVKRVVGTGTVEMTMDNGATWTAVTVTSSWTRVSIPTQTLANPTVGFRIVTSGDEIAIDFVQNEAGLLATSPIETTSVSVTRPADAISYAISGAPQGTLVVEFSMVAATFSANRGIAALSDGTLNEVITLRRNTAGTTAALIIDGGATQANIATTSTSTADTVERFAVSWTANSIILAKDGVIIGTDTSATVPTITALRIGELGNGGSHMHGHMRRATRLTRALSEDDLRAITA